MVVINYLRFRRSWATFWEIEVFGIGEMRFRFSYKVDALLGENFIDIIRTLSISEKLDG